MLVPAILYKDELHKLMAKECWFNEKYKYFNRGYESFDEIVDNTEKQHQFVSINKDGKICGLFFYYVDRHTRSVCGVNAASFDIDPITFGLDVKRGIEDIFTKFNFHKMCFGVVVGNPIEPTYDRLCTKMGGRVVGYYRDDTMLMDGSYADIKVYEVMRTEYLEKRKNVKTCV